MVKKIQALIAAVKWHLFSKWQIRILARRSFKGLQNRSFSVFANNCAAGFIYQDAGLPYLSPTVGLFFHSPCFIKLLKNFSVVNHKLRFVISSKYPSANKSREKTGINYPIAIIGDDIEIHFLHYQSNEEAEEKWTRRLSKMDHNNLLFLFSVRELATDQHVKDFLALPFSNKLCFAAKNYGLTQNLIYFKEYEKEGEMPGADIARISILKKANFAEILNKINK